MKRLLVIATCLGIYLLGTACAVCAQNEVPASTASEGNAAADFARTSAASSAFLEIAHETPVAVVPAGAELPRLSLAKSFVAAKPFAAPEGSWALATATPSRNGAGAPAAAPEPRFVFGGRDDFRFQLALGMSLVRFRSQVYYATAVGTSTSLTYFTNEWLGVEGNVITAFAPEIYPGDHVKYVGYGAGPKIAWRRSHFEPWVHALAGGIHILPQTALGGQNAVAFQTGTGVDYRMNPRFSVRAGVDWISMHLWEQWQSSAQATLSAVLHF